MEQRIDCLSLLKKMRETLKNSGVEDVVDAEWIMTEVLHCSRSMIPFYGELTENQIHQIEEAVEKRAKHIPLAYIFGHTEFMGYNLKVTSDTLIPRLDTEVLVETVIRLINDKFESSKVLDIGTGSGAIAIVVNKETNANVVAVDVSEKALEIAKHNAKINCADVEFVLSNLFENIEGCKFDIIVSNPPYIESTVVDGLDVEVKDYEPRLALDGGEDGLDFYRQIIQNAPKFLNEKGLLVFEIGYNQGNAVSDLMKKDFTNIEIIKDYTNNDRVVLGEKL